jgi:hypothetical protein
LLALSHRVDHSAARLIGFIPCPIRCATTMNSGSSSRMNMPRPARVGT